MRKNWFLLGIALLVAALAIGAVACSDDDNGYDNGGAPTATEVAVANPTDVPEGDAATVIITDGVLTDAAGNTLYMFDNDTAGVSSCNEGCAANWPPLMVDGEATAGDGVGTLATITRDDGTTQVTHNDQPLYYYAADAAPGDRNGDGVGGVWHIVEPGS